MEQLSERLQTPISTAELERRWAAVRAAMERDKIDVLLMQNNNDYMGGNVKYFTDLPATNGYPLTVVFPRDDLMTLVSQGPFGGVNELGVGKAALLHVVDHGERHLIGADQSDGAAGIRRQRLRHRIAGKRRRSKKDEIIGPRQCIEHDIEIVGVESIL